MFDFIKVSNVADYLYSIDSEEFNRSAISRYYYSLFGLSRIYLIFIMGEFNFAKSKDIHMRICKRLSNSSNPTEIALGKILIELRQLRNQADYDWNDNPSFFKLKLDYVRKESKIGIEQIEALKNSPPFNL